MKKVKITVLKTTLDKELAEEYGMVRLKACPMMKVGDVFYAEYAKPDGFCDEAWKAIYQYVFALAHGADKELFYYGDWIRMPGVAPADCLVFEDALNGIGAAKAVGMKVYAVTFTMPCERLAEAELDLIFDSYL